jgi:hypothetical protein
MNSYVPEIPEDLRKILDSDRRVQALESPSAGFAAEHVLAAIEPATHEDRFYRLTLLTDDRIGELEWTNSPKDMWARLRSGLGLGFAKISEPPVIIEGRGATKRRPDVLHFENWLAVSKSFAAIVERFDPGAFEALNITWKLPRGETADYVFMDVTRMIDAYDYRRSNLVISVKDGRKSFFCLRDPRTLKSGIDPNLHLFRDALVRDDILVSNALGRALAEAGLRGFRLIDLVTGRNGIPTAEYPL